MAKILQAYSRYSYTPLATQRALEAALARGRQSERSSDIKQRSLLEQFARRSAQHLRDRATQTQKQHIDD